ncbi:MAG: hypothetical protein ACR2J5_05850 [Geodermatophilaceae bacterium]
MRQLDGAFRGWAAEQGAIEVSYPGVLAVDSLESIDYFKNFPHLGSAVSRLSSASLGGYADQCLQPVSLPPGHLEEVRFMLPSAACYPVYFDLQDTRLDADLLVTTKASCYRNEEEHHSLKRLWNFHMREVVFIGGMDAALAHLDHFRQRVTGFAADIGLLLKEETATDPFFRPSGPRALMQKMDPVKWEYVFGTDCAIASLNFHRNFFGDRCSITQRGASAFTSCVAFGLERWIYALSETFGGDLIAAGDVVRAHSPNTERAERRDPTSRQIGSES